MNVYRIPRDPWNAPAKWHRTMSCAALYYWDRPWWKPDAIEVVSLSVAHAPSWRRCRLVACWPLKQRRAAA